MKVKELIAALSKLDPDLPIICYSEEADAIRVLEIDGVDTLEGEKIRDEKNVATLNLGNSLYSTKIATINVTLDF